MKAGRAYTRFKGQHRRFFSARNAGFLCAGLLCAQKHRGEARAAGGIPYGVDIDVLLDFPIRVTRPAEIEETLADIIVG